MTNMCQSPSTLARSIKHLQLVATIIIMLTVVNSISANEDVEEMNAGVKNLCDVFEGIQKATTESGGALTSKSDWDQRISWTEQILAAVPMDYIDEAEVYLQLVKDRAELVARHGYIDNRSLPQDVRSAFIAEHMDDQLISNRLIEFAKESCNLN